MTDDIVARLRVYGNGLHAESADEITRLRSNLAAARERVDSLTHSMTNALMRANDYKRELAATLERMSKLDFERTAAELERNAARAALAVEREDKQCAVDEAEARRDDLAAARAEKELAYKMSGELSENLYQTTIERDAANALLREARPYLMMHVEEDWVLELIARIDAALAKGEGRI